METVIVIFGGSGDLTTRKLIPALYNNFRKKRLPGPLRIIGISRTPMSDDAFRGKMHEAVRTFAPAEYDAGAWGEFAPSLSYREGDLGKASTYAELARGFLPSPPSCLYYLATAPGSTRSSSPASRKRIS